MNWIKASERLPDSWLFKAVRFTHTKIIICDIEELLLQRPTLLHVIEWLDEKSSLPTIEECMEYAKGLGIYHGMKCAFPETSLTKLIEYAQTIKP